MLASEAVYATQPAHLQVVVPANAKVGDMLSVTAPNGQIIQFAIPEGATEGQTLMIPVPTQPQMGGIEMQQIPPQNLIPMTGEIPPRYKSSVTTTTIFGAAVSTGQIEELNPEVCVEIKVEASSSFLCKNNAMFTVSDCLFLPENAQIGSRINATQWEAFRNDVKETEERICKEHPISAFLIKNYALIFLPLSVVGGVLVVTVSVVIGIVLIVLVFLCSACGVPRLTSKYLDIRDQAIADTLAKHNKHTFMPNGLAVSVCCCSIVNYSY